MVKPDRMKRGALAFTAAGLALTVLTLVGGTFYRAGIIVEKVTTLANAFTNLDDRVTALEYRETTMTASTITKNP